MNYRNLGKWGLKISEVSLGSWVTDLAGTEAEKTALQTVNAAFDAGVNFFDCADAYSGGAAERFLGRALKEPPEYFSPWERARTNAGSRASTSSNRSTGR